MKKGFIIAGSILVVILFIGFIIYSFITDREYMDKNADLASIDYTTDKLNIYLFWGSTCPHCEELMTYFKNLKKEFKGQVRIYGFEVWDNEENGAIMDEFLSEFGEETGNRSVPYFIIGDQDFSGYSASSAAEIRTAIIEQIAKLDQMDNYKSLLAST